MIGRVRMASMRYEYLHAQDGNMFRWSRRAKKVNQKRELYVVTIFISILKVVLRGNDR